MRAHLAVLGLVGFAGCQAVWNLDQFPEPALLGDPTGDFDGDHIPNGMDPCPNLDNSMPGANHDQDGDGVPDLCDPHPSTPGDCLQLFDDFGDPTLSPLWLHDGNPLTVVRNDQIFQNRPYLQFDAIGEEIVYLDKQLDLDAVWVNIYVQAGDNPDPSSDVHAIQAYVDLTRSARDRANGQACAVASSTSLGAVEHVQTVDGADTPLASSEVVPGNALRVGSGNTFTLEWGTAGAPGACQGSTDPTDPTVTYSIAATVPPSGTFAIRGLNVGLFILGVAGWGHNCAAN